MNRSRLLVLATATAIVSLVVAGRPRASDVLGKKLDVPCTTCHDKPGSKLLTDKGKYYETFRSFDGYDALVEAFSACTNCHTSKPGSSELTENGRRFQELVGDMEGLRAWLQEEHPHRGTAEPDGPTK